MPVRRVKVIQWIARARCIGGQGNACLTAVAQVLGDYVREAGRLHTPKLLAVELNPAVITNRMFSIAVRTPRRVFYLHADTEVEQRQWGKALGAAVLDKVMEGPLWKLASGDDPGPLSRWERVDVVLTRAKLLCLSEVRTSASTRGAQSRGCFVGRACRAGGQRSS